MKISKIEIKGLFDRFDHKIDLNLEKNITVIYGINGIGKTMLFKILDYFFNQKFFQLINAPFKELIITFDDESFFILKNNEKFVIEYKIPGEKILNFELFSNKNRVYESLKKLLSKIELYFIDTQRLLIKYDKEKNDNLDTVKHYSNKVRNMIKKKSNEYDILSKKLELSLMERLINKEVEIFSDIDLLKEENRKLNEKREKLREAGLFGDEKVKEIPIPDDIDDITKAILSVNIEDMKEKLKIFDNLYEELNLFLNILNNNRFSYKRILIDPQKGFVFKDSNDKILDITQLSSGEQHEVVMLFELFFIIPENSLVVIDEPEISLHILWQKKFIDDMSEIIKLKKFSILIATHSPSIINGNWDLTVELSKEDK